jgi:hypothetical protein
MLLGIHEATTQANTPDPDEEFLQENSGFLIERL